MHTLYATVISLVNNKDKNAYALGEETDSRA